MPCDDMSSMFASRGKEDLLKYVVSGLGRRSGNEGLYDSVVLSNLLRSLKRNQNPLFERIRVQVIGQRVRQNSTA